MKTRKFRLVSLTIIAVVFLFAVQTFAQDEAKSNPLKKSDLVKALESNSISSSDLVERIKNRGVDFQITESVKKELNSAGATDEIINAVQENYTEPKKKGLFGKIGGGLNKTAKIAVKTAPMVAEQMPQVQAAKAVVNAAKTASEEVEKEKNAKNNNPTDAEKVTAKEISEKDTKPNKAQSQKTTPTKPSGGNSSGLKVGEYACTGSGGQMMIGLGFKVLSGNRFTNLDGDQSGTFTISDGKITFRGGHLDGITGRDLKDNWFTVGSAASCGPYN